MEKQHAVMSFSNGKGGVGKTVLSWLFTNYIFHKTKYKVALISIDPQAALISRLNKSIDLLVEEEKLDKEKAKKIFKSERLYIDYISSIQLTTQIERFKSNYDFIIIDIPGTIHQESVLQCYSLFDYLFWPTTLDDIMLTDTIGYINQYYTQVYPIRENSKKPIVDYILLNNLHSNRKETKELLSNDDYKTNLIPFDKTNKSKTIKMFPSVILSKAENANFIPMQYEFKGDSNINEAFENIINIIKK